MSSAAHVRVTAARYRTLLELFEVRRVIRRDERCWTTSAHREVLDQHAVEASLALPERGCACPDTKQLRARASDDLLEMLRWQRTRQAAWHRELGEGWTELGLVFTTARGTLLDRHNVMRTLKRLCKKTGIEEFGTHSGRHTNITNRLRHDQKPEVVAKIAGHARVSTTLNIYRTVMPDELRAAEFDLGAHMAQARAVVLPLQEAAD